MKLKVGPWYLLSEKTIVAESCGNLGISKSETLSSVIFCLACLICSTLRRFKAAVAALVPKHILVTK